MEGNEIVEPTDEQQLSKRDRESLRAMRRALTRRNFIRGVLGAAVAAGAAGAATQLGPLAPGGSAKSDVDEELAKHQWVMVFDLRKCDGCEKCVKACRQMHALPEGHEWIKVYELENRAGQTYFLPRPCMQCEDPPCVKVCPVKATYKTADGVTLIDQDKCIGCRMCIAACPYEARTFTWDDPLEPKVSLTGPSPEYPVPQQKNTAGKCVFCVHLIRYGKLPNCVEKCTMDAIYMGDLTSDLATNGEETVRLSDLLKKNDAFRLKEELNTRPRVYYIPGHGQDLDF